VKAIQQLFQGGVQNAYLPGMLEQQLKAQQLANAIAGVQAKYADPMTKAELSYKELMPDHLKRQIEELGLKNKYYPRVTESEIASRLAGASLANVQAKYYPEDIKSQIDLRRSQVPLNAAEAAMKQFQVQNPLLSQSGAAGQIGSLLFLQQHPELTGQRGQSSQMPMGDAQPGLGGTQNDLYNLPSQLGNAIKNQAQIPLKPSVMNQGQGQPGNMQSRMGVGQEGLGDAQGGAPDFVNLLQDSIFSEFRRKKAATDYMNTRAQGYSWSQMPAEYKKYVLGQAKAMGYSFDEANRKLTTGSSIGDLAKEKGVDPNKLPVPELAPTSTNITRIQRSNAVGRALDKIEPEISKAYAEYGQRFAGISPTLVKDMILRENPKKQGRMLAAYMLQPELVTLRILRMGGNIGEGAIERMIESSQARLNTLGFSPSSEAYLEAQDEVQRFLKLINKEENKEYWNPTTPQESVENIDNNAESLALGEEFTQDDLEFTAQKYGMSVDDVKKMMGGR
jgi:hypothetical protein